MTAEEVRASAATHRRARGIQGHNAMGSPGDCSSRPQKAYWESAEGEPEHELATRGAPDPARPPLGGRDPSPASSSAGLMPLRSVDMGIFKVSVQASIALLHGRRSY